MTREKMRVIIAEHCGWFQIRGGWWSHPTLPDNGGAEPEPRDYCNDLNAIAEARKSLTPDQQIKYAYWLFWRNEYNTKESRWWESGDDPNWNAYLEENPTDAFKTYDASAFEHATAFIHAIGRWEDE